MFLFLFVEICMWNWSFWNGVQFKCSRIPLSNHKCQMQVCCWIAIHVFCSLIIFGLWRLLLLFFCPFQLDINTCSDVVMFCFCGDFGPWDPRDHFEWTFDSREVWQCFMGNIERTVVWQLGKYTWEFIILSFHWSDFCETSLSISHIQAHISIWQWSLFSL